MRGNGGKIVAALLVAIAALLIPATASAGKKKAKPPKLSIADVTVAETDGPGVNAILTVTASKAPRKKSSRVAFATSDGTAVQPADYSATSGRLPFKRGVKTRVIVVPIQGDDVEEADETFSVELSNPKRAKLKRGSATATITDDDQPPPPLIGIEGARSAPDGPMEAILDDVVVTTVKPPIGTEPAGFFVQQTQAGPALYVEADPAQVSPALAPGDLIDFTVTEMATRDGARVATAISGLGRSAGGQSLDAISKDVSSASDLVSAIQSYESELVDATATIAGGFAGSGTGYSAAPIATAGVPSDANLRLRVPAAVATQLDAGPGCSIALDNLPLVRLGSVAAASAWSAAAVDVTSCPAPRLLSASAPAPGIVALEFDREIDPASVAAGGTGFAIDGLEIIGASASGTTVTLETSDHSERSYTVSVPATVEDARGTPIDSDHDTATFEGNPAPVPPEGIEGARGAPDGFASIPVENVLVTYLKPPVGSESSGFFVQGEPDGPGLYVSTVPHLVPELAAGDRVSFTITTMGTTNGMRRATSIADLTRSQTGIDLAAFAQDVSATSDLVSNLGDYDSELIDLDGTLKSSFSIVGDDYVSARIETAAVSSNNLQLRLPSSVRDSMDLAANCQVSLSRTPLWISGATALATAWRTADIEAECPAPRVTSAVQSGPASITVSFSRRLDPATLDGSGAQFSVSGGLAVTSAAMEGENRVTLQTGTIDPDETYTVTVAGSLEDRLGKGIDPARNSATFGGPVPSSGMLISEIAPVVTDGRDQIEILATADRSIGGAEIWVDGAGETAARLLTLPDIEVEEGELVVVHLLANVNVTTETSDKGSCTDDACHPGAYDVRGTGVQINYNGDRVISIYEGDNSTPIVDTVPLVRSALNTPGFPAEVQAIQAVDAWRPATCGGEPCTYDSIPSVEAVAVSWDGAGTSADGLTISRKPVADTNTAADWYDTAVPGSLGSPNP